MGNLMIEQVIYWGDNYYYSSPTFDMGVQIIEGSNGSGKTTFSSLICYGLGLYVKQFDIKNKDEVHKEIKNDTNNYVLLNVKIDDTKYEFTRYFNEKNNNIVFVKAHIGNGCYENSFPINRSGDVETFSDWLLKRLKINVFDFYQGLRSFKINFSDLFRLIHYDQATMPSKIFKDHKNNGNFVVDSANLRNAIFELLIGHHFSDYYSLIGETKKAERERDTQKRTLESYSEMLKNMGYDLEENIEEVKDNLVKLNYQLDKIAIYRQNLKDKVYTSKRFNNEISSLRSNLLELETEYTEHIRKKQNVHIELNDLLELKEEIILEVTQIRKIIVAHKELNLFSPNTCPYCLKEVTREHNHCICGNEIDESQYERFFYDSNEYLDILKSKQKSVETIDFAIESCQEEIGEIESRVLALSLEREKIENQLKLIEESVRLNSPESEIAVTNDEMLEIREKIQNNEQKLAAYKKLDELGSEFESSHRVFAQIQFRLRKLERLVKEEIEERITDFNKYYTSFLKEADKHVESAELDENYMPIVNDGEYREASANVPKRMLYYFTLLQISVMNDNVPFPRFLLIDTPENLGIDKDNLIKCLSTINNILGAPNDFQILLTTGLGKYPEEFAPFVKETLDSSNKLLQLKANSES
ncbi:hypothetical protein H7S74_13275 [Priestia aryabhattai]|uniref:hypothetical protein n=1 Tax=Priestia aryabhattai TaxID=412384 RepID=UPI001EB3C989|nr:hypothetical protein [Priestia aryabhattai]MBY0091423.1 hypothetical protein [Priestia aryabhattai]MBY0102322.1 hypothetical protein [Priestia aryabhattai]